MCLHIVTDYVALLWQAWRTGLHDYDTPDCSRAESAPPVGAGTADAGLLTGVGPQTHNGPLFSCPICGTELLCPEALR